MENSRRLVKPFHLVVLSTALAATSGCASKTAKSAPAAPEAAKLDGAAVEVTGSAARSAKPLAAGKTSVGDSLQYDVIVVGGGIAGLTSALYLTDGGKKVLVLEPGAKLGASATWSEGRVAARPARETSEILKHFGAGGAHAQAGAEGINYLVRGHYFADLWNPKTLAKLPAGFQAFAFELARAARDHKIPTPPFEGFALSGGVMELDAISADAWIKAMPKSLETFAASAAGEQQAEAKKLAGKLAGSAAMDEVAELADLYCRQTFGASARDVSAMAFASFYAGEVDGKPRAYDRRADLVEKLVQKLENRALIFWSKTDAPVTSIVQNAKGVEVFYNQGQESHRVTAKFVVYADAPASAADVVEGLASTAAAQASLMKEVRTSHVIEHEVRVDGQPLRAGSELWLRASEPKAGDPVALDLWRWPVPATVLPSKKAAAPEVPKTEAFVAREVYTDEHADLSDDDVRAHASAAAARISELLGDLPSGALSGPFTVQKLSSRRWPAATHAPTPGFFTEVAPKLRQPFGRVYFASNTLGVPSLEEALFRGHCAASNVLKKVNKAYQLESWSRCPIDQAP